MKRLPIAIAILALPVAAQANQSLNMPGFSMTSGPVSNVTSLHSSNYNPANGNLLLSKGENLRLGYLSNLGFSAEIGEAENLDLKVDQIVDDLDLVDSFDMLSLSQKQGLDERYGAGTCTGTGIGAEEACLQGVANFFNTQFLDELNRGGQIRFGLHGNVPLLPLAVKSNFLAGTWTFNAAAHVQGIGMFRGDRFGVRTEFADTAGNPVGDVEIDLDRLGDTVNINGSNVTVLQFAEDRIDQFDQIANPTNADVQSLLDDLSSTLGGAGVISAESEVFLADLAAEYGSGTADVAAQDFDADVLLATDSVLDAKAAAVAQLSLGYSQSLTRAFGLSERLGELEAGLRLNYFQAELGRNLVSVEEEANRDGDSEASDKLTEDFMEERTSDSALGVDFGLLWHNRNYQVGATMYNINEPSFKYPNLDDMLTGTTLRAAQALAAKGKLTLEEEVTLTRHTVLEAAAFAFNRQLVVQGSYALNEATNFVGDEHQYATVSVGYFANGWLPGIRAGYRKDLAGTELSTANLGLTLFGVMHLDAAIGLETSTYDGDDVPRFFAVSLGFEEKF